MYPHLYINSQDSANFVQFNLLNLGILFQYMPWHNTNMTLNGWTFPDVWHGFVETMQSWWQFLMYSANILTASFSMSVTYFKAGIFGLINFIFAIFSFSDQIFTTPPSPFLTFFIFVITSCAFEAVITPLLHKYHC